MKRFTRLLAVVLAFVLVFGSIPAAAASKSITVKTQSSLNSALTSGKYTKITIKTSDKISFKIGDGKYTKIELYVKAANATVENSAVFKKIVIDDASVFTEKAIGNTIKVANKKTTVNVAKGAEVKTLALAKKGGNNSVNVQGKITTFKLSSAKTTLNLVNNGTIKKLYVYKADSTVKISGTPDTKTSVITKKAAEDTTIKSESPIKITLYADADVTLQEGAEGSSVTTKAADLNVSVVNDSKKKITVTDNGTKKSVAAGKSLSIGEAATPTQAPTTAPTDTPTPTPTATPTPEPTPEPKKLKITQKSTTVFVLEGDCIKSGIKASDIKLFTQELNGVEIPYNSSSIKSVDYAEGAATVTMYSSLAGNKTLFVRVGGDNGDTASFVTASGYVEDVARFELVTTMATVGEDKTLEFKFYDKNDVDITDEIKRYDTSDSNDVALSPMNFDSPSKGALIITQKNTDNYNVTVYGDTVNFSKEGALALEIKLVKSLDSNWNPVTLTINASVVGRNPAMGEILYTITNDDGLYFKATEKNNANKALYIGDSTNNVFEALISVGGSYKTLVELGYTPTAADENIFMVTGTATSGGWTLAAIREGTTGILLKDSSGTVVATVPNITVYAAKKSGTLDISLSQSQLNVNAGADDHVIIRATVKDQYGNTVSNPSLKAEVIDTKTGTVALGSFTNGTLVIKGTDVSITGTGNVISLKITATDNAALTKTVNFGVKNVAYDPAEEAAYVKAPFVEGSRNLNSSLSIGTQDDDTTYVYVKYTSKDGYFVKEVAGKALSAVPTSKTTASELGIASGTTAIFYTLQYTTFSGTGHEFITTNSSNIQLSTDNIALIPVATGSQLKEGNYMIQFYSITAGDTSSTIQPIGSQTVIKVTCPEPDFKFKKIADTVTVSGSWADKLPKFFEFYWNGELIPASCIIDAEVIESTSGSTTVRSVTFAFVNSVYGSFTKKVDLDPNQGSTLIYIK
ncbi:MAG: hypothetical protein IK071_07025 [Lachnospiraceae bacterium]|nr:hypothetical protein [Lachnospiraceae bacterium]